MKMKAHCIKNYGMKKAMLKGKYLALSSTLKSKRKFNDTP